MQSFCHALYHVAEDPSAQAVLRAEVENAVQKDGWTKNALASMHKADSFLRENQRFNGISAGMYFTLFPLRHSLPNDSPPIRYTYARRAL